MRLYSKWYFVKIHPVSIGRNQLNIKVIPKFSQFCAQEKGFNYCIYLRSLRLQSHLQSYKVLYPMPFSAIVWVVFVVEGIGCESNVATPLLAAIDPGAFCNLTDKHGNQQYSCPIFSLSFAKSKSSCSSVGRSYTYLVLFLHLSVANEQN